MDLYRPIYHFLPEKNWMNDPNGLLYFNEEYHLFYQYNPNADHWDTMHWGHAKSKDLVHWEHLPIALYPSLELGEIHCYSGCTVNDDGVPKILYTSIGENERNATDGPEQWLATSRDGMQTWEKHPGNPVLSLEAHGNIIIKEWRDPFVWKEGDVWFMVVGGILDGKGCALVYDSANLTEWRFLNVLHVGTEGIWECPNFFKLRDKYVLIYSPNGVVKYYTGTWNADYSFTPEASGTIDFSGWEGYYAPNSTTGPDGRRLMWGWIPEASRGDFKGNAGWAGVQSLPREVTLAADGTLRMEPAPELQTLRKNRIEIIDKRIASGSETLDIRGRALEIMAVFKKDPSGSPFGFKLLCSPGREEETIVKIDPEQGSFSVDRTRSSLSELPHDSTISGHFNVAGSDEIKVRLFLDYSVLEVYINDEQCITTRTYPTLESSDGLQVFASGEAGASLKELRVWEMASIWD